MFCGEITTNRRRFYRFRVQYSFADLKSQTRRFRGKFAKHGNKKNNSYRNIISYISANAAEMSGPEMSVTDILRNVIHRPHQHRQRRKLAMTLTAVTLILTLA